MAYNHIADLLKRAAANGYTTVDEALIDLYKEYQSTYKVADAMGSSPTMVRDNLKKLGVRLIGRGKKNTGVVCPKCGGKSLVIDVRRYELWTRRRHECRECLHHFTRYF